MDRPEDATAVDTAAESVTEPTADPADGPGTARAVVLLLVAGLFAYYNSLHGAFLLDDGRFTMDPNVGRPFASEMAPRPVVALSLALNYHLDKYQTRGYHVFNLTVHLLAAVTLFDLLRRTLRLPRFAGVFDRSAGWVALGCATVWMVHPLQTQSVTYVIQRCESMMGLFFFVALWAFVRGATCVRPRRWYALAVASCALGAGCKEMMIALPAVALLYDRTLLAGSWREAIRRRWAVYTALTVPPVVGALALAVSGFFTDKSGTVGFAVPLFTPYTYALTQTEVILHYLRLTFWPAGQVLDYLWPPRRSLAEVWPSALALAALVLATVYGVVRNRAWAIPAAFFFIALAPTSSIIPIQDAAFEHRMYLPLAGVVVLVGCALALAVREVAGRWPASAGVAYKTAAVATGAVVLALGLKTVVRNEDYASGQKLHQDNARKRPDNARVRYNLAEHLYGNGEVEKAEKEIEAALKCPLQLPALFTSGVRVLRDCGRTSEAVDLATRAVKENPGSEILAYELGLSLLADGHPAEAEPHLRRGLGVPRLEKFARAHLGIALMATGKQADADAEFRAADALDTEYAAQLTTTARRAALNPDAKPVTLRLVAWYAEAACRMRAGAPAEYRDTLAICLARVGKFPEAATEAGVAAHQARDHGDAYLAARIDSRVSLYRAGKPYLPE
jgi:tetratricopeptide (TPR) repeat protein